jgi:hypothetical protein
MHNMAASHETNEAHGLHESAKTTKPYKIHNGRHEGHTLGIIWIQIKKIYSGEIGNWNELGGPDDEILVVAGEQGSDTRDTFN